MNTFLELDLEVSYKYSRGYYATREDPGEPPSIIIESVKYNGQELELTDEDYEMLLDKCWEDWELHRKGEWW